MNYLTIDFERLSDRDAYRGVKFDQRDEYEFMLKSLETILELFEKYETLATFFIVGEIMRDYPDLVRRIHDDGNEVAIHGWSHMRLDESSSMEFKKDIEKSIKEYRGTLSTEPLGFRAPQFSLGKETSWALRVLASHGFQYDSSVYPCGLGFYGGNYGPTLPYFPSYDDPSIPVNSGVLTEFPVLVYPFNGLRVPVGGGFWSRLLGFKFLSRVISKTNAQGHPATVYFHNWEFIDNKQWSKGKINTYRNHGIPIKKKIGPLLSSNKFTSIETYFKTDG